MSNNASQNGLLFYTILFSMIFWGEIFPLNVLGKVSYVLNHVH